MKKCLIKGMTVIMISTMLASIPVVSYAAETEPKNLTESAVPESDVQNAVNTVDIPETDKDTFHQHLSKLMVKPLVKW